MVKVGCAWYGVFLFCRRGPRHPTFHWMIIGVDERAMWSLGGFRDLRFVAREVRGQLRLVSRFSPRPEMSSHLVLRCVAVCVVALGCAHVFAEIPEISPPRVFNLPLREVSG